MTDTTTPERVARGVALLDEKLPGWVDRIDLDRLDLGSPCRCILGQTWDGIPDPESTPFAAHANELDLYGEDENDYGFNAGGEDWFADEPEYRALTAEWTRVILARRAGAR
jgi:hypothetical protein